MNLAQGFGRLRTNLEDTSIWLRFRRNVSISVLGSVFSLLIRLAQSALLTRVMKIEDYGRLLIVLNLFVFLDSFLGLRVSDVIFRFFPSFQEQGDRSSVKGLLILCLAICLLSGLAIYGGVVLLSPLLADRLYPHLGLTPLFRIYGCTLLVSTFTGLYEPLLRLHDRFLSIVVPQVIGSLVTLVLLFMFLGSVSRGSGNYNLATVVAAFAVGAFVQSVPPLLQTLRLVKPFLAGVSIKQALRALAKQRRPLTDCFVNSNVAGYLKFAISPGDIFLLGLFSSPAQLACYGLAKQLTAPLALLQSNIQTVVYPEATALVAKQKIVQLKRLLAGYIRWTLAGGGLLVIAAFFLGRFFILRFTAPDYAGALPVFYILTVAAWLMLVVLVFRPLAVSLDLLRWHNVVLLISAAVVVLFIVTGKLDALTMAGIQLGEVLILRSFFGGLVWSRLKRRQQVNLNGAGAGLADIDAA